MAYLDIVRKYGAALAGDPPFDTYAEHAAAAAAALARTGTGFEVNCRGFEHSCAGLYPSPPLLDMLRGHGVDIVTLGSDAHRAGAVGDCLDRGADALRAAGFCRIASFQARRPMLHHIQPVVQRPGFA